MLFFLQLLGAFLLALVIFALVLLLLIRWKLRGWLGRLGEALRMAGAAAVPPFRVTLEKISDEGEEPFFWIQHKHKPQFEARCREFEGLGLEKLGDYLIAEIGTPMTVFVDRATATYGVVYAHPVIGVWCDVTRRYADDTSWTFGTTAYHGMDIPPFAEQKFFPDLPLADVVAKFREEAPSVGAKMIEVDEVPKQFQQAYAREMDWRIERGGATEEEIRRIADQQGNTVTDEEVVQIQQSWRAAISRFLSERVLKQYGKTAGLNAYERDFLDSHGVVIHQRMYPEDLLQAYDQEFFEDTNLEVEDDDEEDEELIAQQRIWQGLLAQLRADLDRQSPQEVFKTLIAGENNGTIWEFRQSVDKPIPADIWVRQERYDDEEE